MFILMKNLLLLLLGIISLSSIQAQGIWNQKNDFPGNARSRAVCFSIGSYGYFGTGNYSGGSIETSDFWQYDAGNDSWLQRANVPNGMQAAIGSSIDGKGYVGLGWWASNGHLDFYEYNPSTNTWASKANYNGNITNDATSIGLGNMIFAGLGAQPYSSNNWDDWKSYNPTTNSWSSMAIFPGVDRRNAGSFTIGSDLFVGGGLLEGGGAGLDYYKYNVSLNSWSAIASCPSTNNSSTRNAGFSLNGKGYFVLNDGLWEYDPIMDSWTSYPLPFSTSIASTFVINNKVYVILANTKEVWEWAPCSNSFGVDVQSACASYTWIDGNTYTSNNNTATHTVPNVAGCDSIITLDLTVNYPNTGTDVQAACDLYTWIDGNTYSSSTNTPTWTLTNSAGCDSIITLDLSVNYSSAGIDVQTACDTYTWIDGNTYTVSNNSATWATTNAAGCDSIVTIDLTIIPLPDNGITQNGSLISADQLNASYQWLDCDNNNVIINGETNQFYSPTTTGNYAVEVTLNGCTDTSTCFLVDFTGLEEFNSSLVSIYPNPSSDNFKIIGIEKLKNVKTFEITSVTGARVTKRDIYSPLIDISSLDNGIYLFVISHENGTEKIRFIKN